MGFEGYVRATLRRVRGLVKTWRASEAGRRRRFPRTMFVAGAAVLATVLGASTASDASPTIRQAVEASVLSVRDTSEAHLVKAVGNVLTEEGKVTGTLPGTARITIDLHAGGGTATARVTLHVSGGSINAQSNGKGHEGSGGWESFGGTMRLQGGTGRYAHASGSGHMYGALNRRNDKLTVQTMVTMRY